MSHGEEVDLNDEEEDTKPEGGEAEVDEDDEAETSSSESSVISSDSSDSSGDDGPPEQLTSKPPQPAPGTVKELCKFYVASGFCRDGDSCSFRHELPERGTGTAYREKQELQQQQQQQQRRQPKRDPYAPVDLATIDRKTIFQRMLEQEHGGEDQLALQVIKYLGKANFFAQKRAADVQEV
jgi:hypothetical protein